MTDILDYLPAGEPEVADMIHTIVSAVCAVEEAGRPRPDVCLLGPGFAQTLRRYLPPPEPVCSARMDSILNNRAGAVWCWGYTDGIAIVTFSDGVTPPPTEIIE